MRGTTARIRHTGLRPRNSAPMRWWWEFGVEGPGQRRSSSGPNCAPTSRRKDLDVQLHDDNLLTIRRAERAGGGTGQERRSSSFRRTTFTPAARHRSRQGDGDPMLHPRPEPITWVDTIPDRVSPIKVSSDRWRLSVPSSGSRQRMPRPPKVKPRRRWTYTNAIACTSNHSGQRLAILSAVSNAGQDERPRP